MELLQNSDKPPLVEIVKVEIMCSERELGPIVLNFLKGKEEGSFRATDYALKEKSICQMKISFKVHNDIVFGLKYYNIVKRAGIIVDKYEEVLGTFPPNN
mmetsp:Transcript_13545/g.13279  ORF Transcript_13545/g.13279 Transcript_13545/m.13279 type:complete len:100 (-) Transcript_13545:203-502(-)|eukprot:CAMPEP_0170556246 /NCGR_PEP_ID=MMETSP0211-20121228/15886_1 /TAXON_ID=311385 /ORGANISM="Pseudokeronopsis sp., Strain OXSARD2" /LENGTH=99 /DNA_ID=CAMNT_0010866459 /DNA_START=336 /DNA_END=635 /DNA_ORIENTATION=+